MVWGLYSRQGQGKEFKVVQGGDKVLFKLLGKELNYLEEVDYLYYKRAECASK